MCMRVFCVCVTYCNSTKLSRSIVFTHFVDLSLTEKFMFTKFFQVRAYVLAHFNKIIFRKMFPEPDL